MPLYYLWFFSSFEIRENIGKFPIQLGGSGNFLRTFKTHVDQPIAFSKVLVSLLLYSCLLIFKLRSNYHLIISMNISVNNLYCYCTFDPIICHNYIYKELENNWEKFIKFWISRVFLPSTEVFQMVSRNFFSEFTIKKIS